MSRSKGAGGLRGLIERQGGERIRFFLLRTHYRSTIVFSEEGIVEAGTALDKFYQLFDRYQRMTGQPYYLQTDDTRKLVTRRAEGDARVTQPPPQGVAGFRESFLSKMDDDFNTGAAVSDLFQILTALNKFADQHQLDDSKRRTSEDLALFTAGVEVLRELSSILGLFQKPATRASDDQLTRQPGPTLHPDASRCPQEQRFCHVRSYSRYPGRNRRHPRRPQRRHNVEQSVTSHQ